MAFFNAFLVGQAENAAETGSAAGGAAPIMNMVLWMVILFGFLWFFMIRPQQNDQKRRQKMWDELKVYDKILTVGGMYGVITQINAEEGTLILRIDETANVKVRLEISCVAAVVSDSKVEKEK